MSEDQAQTPADEDEFAKLPDPPRRRSPAVALVVIGLAVVVGVRLRSDVQYAFSGGQPQLLGDARSLAARGVPLEDNRYCELSGQPDRRNSLYLEPRGEKDRLGFFRLLGTDSRVFVRALDPTGRKDLADRWAGRLRRFDALPYAPSLREYFGKDVQAARWLTKDALRDALSGSLTVRDRAGEPLTLTPQTTIDLAVNWPDELAVPMSREKLAALADAKHEVERVGVVVTGGAEAPDEFRVFVRAPLAERNAVIAKLEAAGLAFQRHDERVSAKLAELKLSGDGVTAGARSIPLAAVEAASIDAPIAIGPDAWVLLEGEAPASLWWAPALLGLLVAFAAFNVWYLLRSRDSRPRQPATKEG